MAGESIEPTRRKHRRSSSTDDAEERSKRRKHRHHRHRHHHRHRSSKEKEGVTEREELVGDRIDDAEVSDRKLENSGEDGGSSLREIPAKRESGLAGVDYEMEEGEIVDDDGVVEFVSDRPDKSKKNLHSNEKVEGIKTNRCSDPNMGIKEDSPESVDKTVQKLGKDKTNGKESVEINQNRGYSHKLPEVDSGHRPRDDKQFYNFVDEVDGNSLRKSSSSEKLLVAKSHTHDKPPKESSLSNLCKSPERSRRRSRSRSIMRELSVDDPYYRERKHQSASDDERSARDARKHRHGSIDIREKERERSSSSRYTERLERPYSRETRDTRREGSRDIDRDRDRFREKERKEEVVGRDRERNRLRDRYRGEREQDMRENDRDWERERGRDRERGSGSGRDRDRVREDQNRDRERNRQGVRDGRRASDRDKDWDNDRRQNYDSRHKRNYEEYHRETTRTGLENGSSRDNQEKEGNENLDREDDKREDYQENIAELAEQEEDDLERIKEESRRRRQAILEKYKNKEQNTLQVDAVGDSPAQVESAEAVPEKSDDQVEGADDYVPELSFAVGKLPSQNGLPTIEMPSGTVGLGEGTPKSERSDDMFCDDIFGESPAGVRKTGKGGDGIAVERGGLHDNWDDAEGYYGYRFGEVLDGRYEIIAAHGKGVFSTVVRAKDLKAKTGDPEEVAIKIIRNNETMYKAGMEELVILKKLVGADPESKRHCVRFLSTFKYRNHLCLVFESLHMNLREVLKKFGRNIGLKLTAVRAYAKQLFIALKHLKNCSVLHCDIKPDNMLVNEAKNVLKLCDFGNAMFAGKNEITPYLVSRFYRAPEIILGLPYDHSMDIWSVGCCLFELYTGKVLFPGPSNNDMLRLHMELKGPFPKKMLRKGAFTDQHFDQDLNFLAIDEDPVSKKPIRRLIVNIKPKDFGSLISVSPGEDPKLVANFRDLMEKIFVLDPDKRFTVSQALSHPFITGK